MPASYGSNALEFLVSTLVNLYVMVIVLRFLMQTFRVDYYNPVSQFAVKLTSPLLVPLRRFIPSVGGLDMSTLVLAWLILLAKMLLFKLLNFDYISVSSYMIPLAQISIPVIVYLAFVDLIVQFFDIFFFLIIVQAILSWINPNPYNPVHALLFSLTAPLLAPFKKLIPPIAGIDLSPLFALIALQVIKMLVLPVLLAIL